MTICFALTRLHPTPCIVSIASRDAPCTVSTPTVRDSAPVAVIQIAAAMRLAPIACRALPPMLVLRS